MPGVHCASYIEARNNLKNLLDAAESGQVATVRRESVTAAFLDAARLRRFLASVVPSRVQAVHQAGSWSLFIPGLPIAADGATFNEAVADMVEALRAYAQDWQDRLRHAVNHQENWGLVQLISLSDDEQLREWLVGVPL